MYNLRGAVAKVAKSLLILSRQLLRRYENNGMQSVVEVVTENAVYYRQRNPKTFARARLGMGNNMFTTQHQRNKSTLQLSQFVNA